MIAAETGSSITNSRQWHHIRRPGLRSARLPCRPRMAHHSVPARRWRIWREWHLANAHRTPLRHSPRLLGIPRPWDAQSHPNADGAARSSRIGPSPRRCAHGLVIGRPRARAIRRDCTDRRRSHVAKTLPRNLRNEGVRFPIERRDDDNPVPPSLSQGILLALRLNAQASLVLERDLVASRKRQLQHTVAGVFDWTKRSVKPALDLDLFGAGRNHGPQL